MNILNIIQGTGLGGMEQSSLNLMREMKNLGCHFSVLSLTETGALKSSLDKLGINCTGLKYRGIGGWRNYYKYRDIISSCDADAIMMTGHSLIGMLAIGNNCKKKRILFVHYHHTFVKSYFEWKLIYFFANKIFQHIFFVSKFIMNEAVAINPKISQKSAYLPNPLLKVKMTTPSAREAARKALNLKDEDIVIGNAGWLIQRKRFDVFLRVCAGLKKRKNNIKIIIAGDGEEKENLIHLSKTLGIADDIIWLGWQKDMKIFYNTLDIMLFNSDWDAVGLSPLESIQRGIPTFTSVLHGGLKEILKDKFSIFFQGDHNEEKLVTKIQYAINNKKEVRQLTLSCREHINHISDSQRISRKVLETYK